MKRTNARAGFTIVELLIVMLVLGIITALILNTIASARVNAEATAIAKQLQDLRRSFVSVGTSEGRAAWWSEQELRDCDTGATTDEPFLDEIVPGCQGFNEFIQASLLEYQGQTKRLRYDNDNNGSATLACGTIDDGVNLTTLPTESNFTSELISKIDETIDGDDGSTCGRFRWDAATSVIHYRIGHNQTYLE